MAKRKTERASDTRRRTQKERSEKSDRMLIDACSSLLARRGIAGSTLVAIGEHAGYSRTLVSHSFGNKAHLFAEVVDAVANQWNTYVTEAIGEARGLKALQMALDILPAYIKKEPQAMRAYYLLLCASIDPAAEYRVNVAGVHERQRISVQEFIEAARELGEISASVDCEASAYLVCGAVDGLIYRWLVSPDLPLKKLFLKLRRNLPGMLCTRN